VFSLIHLIPGDPVQAMLGDAASPESVTELRSRLGLDRPLYIQYAAFLKDAAQGNLGTSLRTNEPVTAAIAERLPATFELALAAMLVAVAIAIPAGIVAAVWADRSVDRGDLDAEFLAGAAARDRVLGHPGVASGIGPWDACASCTSRDHPRGAAGRRPRADDQSQPD
jgi:hypothetical protein